MSISPAKTIYIFLREYLMMGGIETYIYDQAKQIKAAGGTVVWVKNCHAKIDSSFEHVFYDGETIVWNETIDQRALLRMVEGQMSRIVVVAFNIYDYTRAERFKHEFTACPVHTFFFVPNFVGPMLYLEEVYNKQKQEQVRRETGVMIRRMHQNGNMRYFNEKHIRKMTSNYDYTIENENDWYVPPRSGQARFDEARSRFLATRERFNLFTVSRFDFPHKGYVLGLIKAYAELKQRYPRLELTIVGYGVHQNRVEEAIADLPEIAKRDVHLCPKASQEELTEYYKDANLNISVAGCCSSGARVGTLSVPARHFDYSCEVYGFLPESKSYIVSDEPGEPATEYIEKVLNMSEEEYVALCKAGFDCYDDPMIKLRRPITEIENVTNEPTLTTKEIRRILWIEFVLKVKVKCRKFLRKLGITTNKA